MCLTLWGGIGDMMDKCANPAPELSRTYCVLFAIASGGALSAGASEIGLEGSFASYLLMLIWGGPPFVISRRVFNNRERSWAVLSSYIVLCMLASLLYPLGFIIPFIVWPMFFAARGKWHRAQYNASVKTIGVGPAHDARNLLTAGFVSLLALLSLTAVSLWWAGFSGRDVRNEVTAFCASVSIGDDTAGLDKKASVALNGSFAWTRMPNGELELVVDKYTAFTRSICTITAAGGKVTSRKKWGYAL